MIQYVPGTLFALFNTRSKGTHIFNEAVVVMFRFLTVFTILVLGLFSSPTFAKDQLTSRTKKKKVVVPTPSSYQWPNMISAEYTPETKQNPDSNMFYVFDFQYQPSYTHHFRWFQRVSQMLNPPPGEDNSGEITVLDPRFQYFYNFKDPSDKSYHLALRLGTQLGTSKQSKLDGIDAISNFRLEFDKSIGIMIVSLRPYVSYWSTQYSTNYLGEALPMFTVGHNLSVVANITSKLSWNTEFDTGFQIFQPADVKVSQEGQVQDEENAPLETSATALYFGTDLTYMITDNFQIKFGWYQVDKFMNAGLFDVELFNSKTTRYMVGFDVLF